MRCPSCGAEIADPEGVFCSRCGTRLGSSEDETGEVGATASSAPIDEVTAADRAAQSDSRFGASATDEVVTSGDTRPIEDAPRDTRPVEDAPQDTRPIEDAPRAAPPAEDSPRAAPPAEDSPRESSTRSPSAAVMATEMAGSLGRTLRSGRWPELSSAASMGFLAVLGVGALFVGLLKLVDPFFGSDRNPLWVLTRVVLAGLASLGIPVEQDGAGGSILPMGTLVLVAWALVWASRTVVAASGLRTSGERVLQGAKVGAPFAILCFVAALVFRVRDGVDTGADPGLALVIGGIWGAVFGAAGGLLADSSQPTQDKSTDVLRAGALREGVTAGATMLVSAALAAMAAALVFVIVDLIAGTNLDLTAADAVALVILIVAFAPNIAVGTVAFSMGAPLEVVAESLGVGFRTNFSLLAPGDSGPGWYLYFALLIPLFACLFGGYLARRRTDHPRKMIEIIAVAAGVLSIGLSLLVYMGALSLERGLLGPGNLLVLAPDATAVFFLSLLWGGILGIVGWKVAESQPRPEHPDQSDSPDRSPAV